MARSRHEESEIRRVDRILKNLGLPTWTDSQAIMREYLSDNGYQPNQMSDNGKEVIYIGHPCDRDTGYCFLCKMIEIVQQGRD